MGNKKLKKKIKKQKIKANKALDLLNFNFSFRLNPPLELKWYLAFFLYKFSIINSANINNNKKNDN